MLGEGRDLTAVRLLDLGSSGVFQDPQYLTGVVDSVDACMR